MASSNTERKKVIIVGAGFSGLSVAYHLDDSKFDVQILEARDRLGGRVYPYDLDGTMIDLGGQWVHEASRGNPIRQLMEELKIPFAYGSSNKKGKKEKRPIFDDGGKEISVSTYKLASKFYYKALHEYDDRDVDVTTSFQDLLNRALQSSSNKVVTDEFAQALNYLCHRSECYEGGRLNEVSAYLDEIYENLGGPDQVPEGGYNEVIKAVAAKIGDEKIRLGCVVESIDYESNTAEGNVSVNLGGGKLIKGDICVCTVPLGVLQHRKISFSPQLPEARWSAIDAIGMGLLDKVALKFDRCFWEYHYFATTDADPTLVKNFYDCSNDVGAPVLLMFLGGDAARRIDSPTGMSDEEAVSEAMESLRSIFGDDIPNPVATKVTRWNLDPFAYGAYSFAKIGSTEEDYDEVATPLGNLLFAGEHTSKHAHSCVHGAWATGQREASRLHGWLTTTK